MGVKVMRRYGQVTITAGQSLSDAYDVGEYGTLVGIIVPTWTAADLSLEAAGTDGRTQPLTFGGPGGSAEFRDGLTYRPVFDAEIDAEWGVSVATGNVYVAIHDGELAGLQFIKVRSGTSAAPVVQAGTITITLVSTC